MKVESIGLFIGSIAVFLHFSCYFVVNKHPIYFELLYSILTDMFGFSLLFLSLSHVNFFVTCVTFSWLVCFNATTVCVIMHLQICYI